MEMRHWWVWMLMGLLACMACTRKREPQPQTMPSAGEQAAAEQRFAVSFAAAEEVWSVGNDADSAQKLLLAGLADSLLLPPRRCADAWKLVAETRRGSDDLQGAVVAFRQALRWLAWGVTVPDSTTLVSCGEIGVRLANDYARLGMQAQSAAEAMSAIACMETAHGWRSAAAMKAYAALAMAYHNDGRYREADSVRTIVWQVRDTAAGVPPVQRFNASLNLADTKRALGHFAAADALLRYADSICAAFSLGGAQRLAAMQAHTELSMARGAIDDARRHSISMISLADSLGQPLDRDAADRYIQHGSLLLGLGSHRAALDTFRLAFGIYVRGAGGSLQDSVGSVWALGTDPNAFIALTRMARAMAQVPGREEAAIDTFDLAFRFVDALRHGFGNTQWKADISAQSAMEFEFAVWMAAHRNLPDKAFEWMERAKENELLDVLQDLGKPELDPLPADTQRSGEALLAELRAAEVVGDRGSARALRTRLREMETATQRSHPGHIKLEPDLATPAEVAGHLPGDTALFVSYLWGVQHLGVAVVSRQRDTVITLAIDSLLEADLATLRGLLGRRAGRDEGRAMDDFGIVGYRVYCAVLRPALLAMGDTLRWRRLIISPDGPLATVPFEPLLTRPVPRGTPYQAMPYLVRQSVVSYIQSGTLFLEQGQRGRGGVGALGLGASGGYRGTKELAFVDDEIDAVLQAIGGEGHTDLRSAEHFLKHADDGFGILHIAAHGELDPRVPLQSRLLLQAEPSRGEDGYLYAYEVIKLRLARQMAVLSACNSGLGGTLRGHESMSMGYAFHLAGCPTLLMSLWLADDATTAQLMQAFYCHLASGKPAAVAFAAAQRQFLETASPDVASPRHWAPFILMGDGELAFTPAEQPSPAWPWAVGALALSFALAAGGFWRRRRRFRWA